jgi:hypothetical protein
MRRLAVGIAAGLAIWFGSAVVAEAQSPTITPTGPLSIHVGASGATFTATVQLDTLQDYAVQLFVYRGANPTPIWCAENWFYSPTSLTNSYSTWTCWSPNAVLGQKYTFKAYLVLTNPSQVITATPWAKFVTTNPGTYLLPSKPSNSAFVAIDRDRRHEA